jgi:hypothetical protein
MDGRATYPSPERGGSHCLFASTEEGFGRVLIRGKRGEASGGGGRRRGTDGFGRLEGSELLEKGGEGSLFLLKSQSVSSAPLTVTAEFVVLRC